MFFGGTADAKQHENKILTEVITSMKTGVLNIMTIVPGRFVEIDSMGTWFTLHSISAEGTTVAPSS